MRERRRLAAVFVLCAVAAAAIVGGGLWRLGAADGAPPDAAAVVVLTVLGLCAALGFVWALFDPAPLTAAFEKLRGGAAAPAPVALRPVAGGGALEARMAPIVEPDGDMRGYVLSFAAPGPPPPVPVSDGLPSRPVSVAAGGISLPCHSAQAS